MNLKYVSKSSWKYVLCPLMGLAWIIKNELFAVIASIQHSNLMICFFFFEWFLAKERCQSRWKESEKKGTIWKMRVSDTCKPFYKRVKRALTKQLQQSENFRIANGQFPFKKKCVHALVFQLRRTDVETRK